MLSLFFLITYLLNSSYVVVVSPFFIINRFVVYYCCGFSQYKKDICYLFSANYLFIIIFYISHNLY